EIGKESSPTEMENKDSPDQTIIIGQSVGKKTKEPISRVPIPPKERYESFVGVLTKEYGIQNELSKQSRFVLIEELLQYAVDERNPDRAYAIFSIVIEQLKLLRHCQSSAAFASSLSARFQIDVPSAKVKYLKLLTPVIDSQVSLVAYLNEVELVVQELESTESYLSAEELLKNVIQIGQSPMGRWMDLPYFSRLLNSFQLKKEIHQKMAELISRRKSGDLTPQDHRLLGAFHCFMDSDWDVGMEHYRQSNLKPIVAVAQKFADFNPSDLDAMVEMAELWFAASESMEKESSLFRARSLYWFGEYQKLASSEQIAKKTSKRIEELTQDFGLKGPLSDRSIPPALLLDRNHQEHLQSGTTAKSIRFLDSRHVGVLHEEGFRIFDVLGKRVVFDDFSYQYFDHPIVVTQDAGFAILKPREGLLTYQMGELQASGDFSRPSRRLQAKQPIRAADISTDGTVFALADQLIYRWRSEPSSNPQPTQQPDFTKSSAAFIPKRIRVIPGSSSLVLAGHRNLIRVSKSNTTSTLFSGKNIVDFDLAENGIGIAIAAEDRIFYRAFRGTRKAEWTVAWKPLAIRFLSNPRYMVTLHADHSICTWDVANSSDDQLVDRVQLDDFEAVDLAVQPGGEKLAVLGKDSRIRFLTLQVQ
ncbi:MAG: WD40 repeat domain-containing protein, partial [Pirellulaceae bacterium]|nr:WD40 repeat domain-containing protein [Pirellulaceae bacterium]